MVLYILAFLAGALTVFGPCILPVLPFVFARTGRPFLRGSLPLLIGMALSFAAVASLGGVAGAWVAQFNQAGRAAALVSLALFAAALVWPAAGAWSARLWRPLVALGERLAGAGSDTSWPGSMLLGVATGLLWSPCAGPILGLILSGAALAGPGLHTSLLLLAYAGGAALALAGVLRLGARTVAALLARLAVGAAPRRALGVAMLAGVLAVATGLDTGFLARWSPAGSGGVEARLLDLAMGRANAAEAVPQLAARRPSEAEVLAGAEQAAARLQGASAWLNGPAPGAESLRGKVVLVNFWTYSCINCLRTLPYVRAWAEKYRDQGLVVVGAHAPEFAFERNVDNVRRAARDLGLNYPIAVDNDFRLWRSFGNQYWPALYLVDASGQVRHRQFGEGGYAQTERAIREALQEAGHAEVAASASAEVQAPGVGQGADNRNVRSSETYVGYRQAEGFASPGGIVGDRLHGYRAGTPVLNRWGLDGGR